MYPDDHWIEEREKTGRAGQKPTYQAIPVDKYGPIKLSPPLSVKIVCVVLFVFACYSIFSAVHEWPVFHGDRSLPYGTPMGFFRLLYLVNLQFAVVNAALGVLLLLLVRFARIAAILALAAEFCYAIGFLILKALILERTIIPLTKDPSLSGILLILILSVVALLLLVILGSMAVVLMDVDVVKVYEGRDAAEV